MIRVVVADDEEKVCQLICHLLPWEAYGMEIVGVAYNGLEALDLVASRRPDLLITDIRMPACDGLELIERAKGLAPDLHIVIISGYRHFDYAQTAIKFGVSDYLLKPINRTELAATLERAQQAHLAQQAQSARLSSGERGKEDALRLRKGALSALLSGQRSWRETPLSLLNAQYHFHFSPARFTLLVVKIDCPPEEVQSPRLLLLQDKLSESVADAFSALCGDGEICFLGTWGYVLLNHEAEREAALRARTKELLDDWLANVELFPGMTISFALGESQSALSALADAQARVEDAARMRLVWGSHSVLRCARAAPPPALPLAATLGEMESALQVCDREALDASVDGFCGRLRGEKELDGSTALAATQQMYAGFLFLLQKLRWPVAEAERLQAAFDAACDLQPALEKLFAHLRRTVLEEFDRLLERRKQQERQPIREAKQYIQQHYMSAIGLEEVAEYVGFNATYFSTLFKKQSGQSFSEYLSEVRMDKAKQLLRESKDSIAQIGQRVGYADSKYFTRSFKKATGLKPNEFRKLYS